MSAKNPKLLVQSLFEKHLFNAHSPWTIISLFSSQIGWRRVAVHGVSVLLGSFQPGISWYVDGKMAEGHEVTQDPLYCQPECHGHACWCRNGKEECSLYIQLNASCKTAVYEKHLICSTVIYICSVISGRRMEPSGFTKRRIVCTERHYCYQGNKVPSIDRSTRSRKSLD